MMLPQTWEQNLSMRGLAHTASLNRIEVVVVVHACNSNTREAEAGDFLEHWASTGLTQSTVSYELKRTS